LTQKCELLRRVLRRPPQHGDFLRKRRTFLANIRRASTRGDMRSARPLLLSFATAAGLALGIAPSARAKPFEQYIKATPTVAPLTSATWGATGVLPRDISNGIESAKGAGVHPDYYYWDGEIIK